jgi:ribosomal protein S18 acetylase RimI-like enzyme
MVTIQKVQIADVETLLSFSKKTFYEFFAHLNDPANMEAYSVVAFTLGSILEQINNPFSEFYFALYEDDIVGYIKLNFNDAQTEFKHKNALEVERIYVSGDYHGKYIGKQLLDFAINIALSKQFDYVWLGVWEHNYKARGFYERYGFEVIGSHEFLLGDDNQTDLLMKKPLSEL